MLISSVSFGFRHFHYTHGNIRDVVYYNGRTLLWRNIMQEVLKKAADLVEVLEKKIATTDVLNKQLSDRKAYWDSTEKRQQAADNQLSARERIVTKFEDVQKAKDEVKETARRVAEDKLKINIKTKELDKRQKSLEAQEKELEEMKAVFAKKNANMDAREIEYDAKFKLMKKKVVEELTGKL